MFLVYFLVFFSFNPCQTMILRFNEKGLQTLADFTRTWMNDSISTMSIESYTHKIHKGIAAGDLNLQKIRVSRFFPPLVRYRSNEHGFYMTTLGGQAELQAEWELESAFLSLFAFPFTGEVHGRIAGLQSEVSVRINPETNEFIVQRCAARFNDFRIRLSGSLAADILHWFRAILGKAMKKRVEETYCRMISLELLPWLQHQLTKFPNLFDVHFGENIRLSQSLHSISLTSNHVDLLMKNKFITNGHLIETLSTLPTSFPNQNKNLYETQKMMELFIDEPTIQEIVSAAHFSGQFRSNMTSPFLKTDCEVFCLGTLFPELADQLGPAKLIVEVKTLESPIIKLLNDRAFVFLNASVEMFDNMNLTSKINNDIIDSTVDITNPVLLDPVISIEVSGEAELFLQIENQQLFAKLKLKNTRALVLESKLTDLSQKTLDFIVNLSTPFLEDAVQVFLGDGTPIHDIFKVNTRNETLTIHNGFVRLQTDLIMENFLD